MNTRSLTNLLLGLCCVAGVSAPGQSSQPGTTQSNTAVESWIQHVRNPVSWLTLGGDFRARNEYFNNTLSLTELDPLHEQDVMRFRARIWASAMVVSNLSVNACVSAEPRLWLRDAAFGPMVGDSGMEWRYGILDTLNVKWNNILDQPLSLTVGRQDIMLGDFYDWWLVGDGTPGDGSWSFYLDAVRLTYDVRAISTRLDVIYINQTSGPDDHFPTFGYSRDYFMAEQDEEGAIFYASNKSLKNTTLDAYFMYKADDQVRANGSDGDIYTIGGKVTGTPLEKWQYSAEGAYQFGNKRDLAFGRRDIDAFGGKGRISYLCKDPRNFQVNLTGEYLSGDDPDTEQDEMFDLLWGRWPRWSELYIYSYPVETAGRIAQINNILRLGTGFSCAPVKGMNLSAAYNALFAPEEIPTRSIAPARFSNNGHFRGHFLQAVVKHQFNKHVSGHLWGECVWQGDYYARRDLLSFVRAEIMFSF